jgi:hypothetical protein
MPPTTCPACGREVPDGAATCPACGHALDEESAALGETGAARPWGRAMLIGAAAVVLGSFLPWATVSTFIGSVNVFGTEGDGVLTLFIGAVLAFVAFRALSPGITRGATIFAIVACLILFAIALYDFIDIQRVASDLSSVSDDVASASVGYGLWIVLIGSAVATVGSFGILRKQWES